MNNEPRWGIEFDKCRPTTDIRSATDLVHAIEQSFSYPQDGFSIRWVGGHVRIPYAYGLSDLVEDLLPFLTAMQAPSGRYAFSIAPSEPDAVDADWRVSWDGARVEVDADWRATSAD